MNDPATNGGTMETELSRLRRELRQCHYDTPEYARVIDRIAVLVREAAVARRAARCA